MTPAEVYEYACAGLDGTLRDVDKVKTFFAIVAKTFRPGGDEMSLLDGLAFRLNVLGRGQYGRLNLTTDARNMLREALQESLDMNIYLMSDIRQLEAKVRDLETTVQILQDIATRARLDTIADDAQAGVAG